MPTNDFMGLCYTPAQSFDDIDPVIPQKIKGKKSEAPTTWFAALAGLPLRGAQQVLPAGSAPVVVLARLTPVLAAAADLTEELSFREQLPGLKMTLTKENSSLRKQQVDDDIERLKEWLSKQPHLPHDVDDALLRSFVCGTKGLEIAKQKLDSWFSYKPKVPSLFSNTARNCLNAEFKEMSKAVKMYFLPKPTPEGYRVMWYQAGEDFSLFNHTQKIARSTMQIELLMSLYPDMKGMICVYDMENLPGATLLSKLSAPSVAAGLQWFQAAIPIKLKKVLVVNSIPIVDMIMNTLVKPFMKEKLYNRIIVTSEGEKMIKKNIPADILPADYGGNDKHSDEINADWVRMLEERADWFQETAKLMSDEKKRPADKAATYGVEGTFRTLALD